MFCPVGSGCRIHRLLLCRGGKTPPPNEYPRYDTKLPLMVLDHWRVGPVGLGCWIHRLHFCRGLGPPNVYPGYDAKQSDDEVLVMLELWGMHGTSLLPSLAGPLWPGVVAPDRVLSMSKKKELNCVLILNWIVWNRTVGYGGCCRIHRLHLFRGVRPPANECPVMTLNNFMKFQWYWGFGECGAPLHCHRSQVHSGMEW